METHLDGDGEVYGNDTVITGTWYHLTAVWESSTSLKLYVNGTLVDEDTSVEATLDNNSAPHTIGARDNTSVVDQYFDGQIDDVKIFNYALTEAQILTDYNQGAVRFGE